MEHAAARLAALGFAGTAISGRSNSCCRGHFRHFHFTTSRLATSAGTHASHEAHTLVAARITGIAASGFGSFDFITASRWLTTSAGTHASHEAHALVAARITGITASGFNRLDFIATGHWLTTSAGTHAGEEAHVLVAARIAGIATVSASGFG
jgi:hypothetical protein